MDEHTLQTYLSSEYQGEDSFLKTIIFPIFGEENYETAWQLPVLEDEELQGMAARTGIKDIIKYGTISVGHVTIDIFDVTVTDSVQMQRNRVGIQQLIRRIMNTYSSAFIIFHYKENWQLDWRFSFCQKDDKNITEAKRYTFLLGPGQSCRTAAQNFMKLLGKNGNVQRDDIVKAFDVEALSKEFFNKYKEHYDRFCAYVYNNKENPELFGEEFTQCEDKTIRDYVKKLLGRIVFLHFLQKKGWMGVPADKPWGEGDRQFMKSLFDKATDEQKANYLDEVLEPLFAEALDVDRKANDDLFDCGVEGFRNVKIPYLNGGLFERDKMDEPKSTFSRNLFADLFNFLYQYNFTIDENDPNDAEVGVDPEMLGRIFENLLEDNKDKGAFYTPKEIVQYMCRESLIAYLQTDVEDEAVKSQIREFVATYNAGLLSADLTASIDQKLKDVKICDPAIGSGAFPMGLMKELYLCRSVIEGFDGSKAAEIKKHIIQQNIYGVDIEKGAVDIARLRFWLSLILDEETPHALPNLDFKIMQGNSLLEQYEGIDLSGMTLDEQKKSKTKGGDAYQMTLAFDEKLALENIQKAIKQYYLADSHEAKLSLRKIIDDNVKNYILNLKGCTPDIQRKLENLPIPNDQFFLWHIYFKEVFDKGGFDIVIGNPPYVVTQVDDFQQYEWNTDLYKMFFELSLKQLMHRNSVLAFITPKFFLLNKDDYKQRMYFLDKVDLLIFSLCNPFETAVTENVITLLRTCEPSSEYITIYAYNNGSFERLPLLDKMYCKGNRYSEMVLGIDDNTIRILKKVKQKGIPFGCIMTSKRGAEISKKNLRETMDGIPSLIGMDMKRYSIEWSATYLSRLHKEYRRLSPFFDRKMIFLRRVAPRLESTYANGVLYAYNKNVYGIRLYDVNKWVPQYIVALLNSNVLDFYYKKRFTLKKEDVFPEIQAYLYEQLPIATATQVQQRPIITLVDRILAVKKANPLADTTAEEREIDRLVYDLYGLTEDEIAIVEGTTK